MHRDVAVRGGSIVRRSHDRLSSAIRALLVLTIVANVVFFAGLMLPGDPAPEIIDIAIPILAQWAPVGVFWLVAVRTRFARPEVVLAAAGVTCNAAADTFYTLAMDSSGELPSPSPADIGYLLYYPLILAALLVLVVRQSQGSLRPALFDGAVASLGAAAVLAVILGPVFTDAASGTSVLGNAIAGLDPLFDLILITAVVAISASPALRIGTRWPFLVAGFLLFTGADIAYALLTRADAYAAGTPLDALWTMGVACLAIWVDGVTRLPADARTPEPEARVLPVPALAVLAGLAVLLIATQTPVSPVALILAAATVVLAAVSVLSRHAAASRMLRSRERLVTELQALDRAKSDMIHTMSHEMRTPLTSILGYLDLVLDDDLSAETQARLHVVERHARRLQDLAANMLMLTRLDAGEDHAVSTPVGVERMLRRVEASARPLAQSRQVELRVSADGAHTVSGDEGELELALAHVVDNAVKFTPAHGSVDVDVRTTAGSDGTPHATVTVTDTGMGISPDDLPRVFDRFFRGSHAQQHAVQGSGLGLAIAREIVRSHGGEVTISSELGRGTVLRVDLPLQPSPALSSSPRLVPER